MKIMEKLLVYSKMIDKIIKIKKIQKKALTQKESADKIRNMKHKNVDCYWLSRQNPIL